MSLVKSWTLLAMATVFWVGIWCENSDDKSKYICVKNSHVNHKLLLNHPRGHHVSSSCFCLVTASQAPSYVTVDPTLKASCSPPNLPSNLTMCHILGQGAWFNHRFSGLTHQ